MSLNSARAAPNRFDDCDQDDSADDSNYQTVDVKTVYTAGTESVHNEPADYRSDDTNDNVS